jgi:hypothetical protein
MLLLTVLKIETNLPASEEAFENGIMGETVSLQDALTPEGASRITPFGGVILSACLFGHNFEHLHKTGSDTEKWTTFCLTPSCSFQTI